MSDQVLALPNDIGSGDDALVGMAAIARFLNESERRTSYILERGYSHE